MNTTIRYTAAVFAAAAATWSFATGSTWPGILAVVAVALIVISTIRQERE